MDEAIDPITGIVGGKKPASSNNEDDHSKGRQENNDDDGDSVTEEMEEVPLPAKIGKSPTGTKLDAPPVSSTDKEETETTIPSSSKRKPMEPLEVETATTAEITEEELYDDMESLLHSSDDSSPDATTTTQKSKAKQSGGGGLRMKSTQTYCCGHVKPQPVGNMKILLPERFEQSGWGVLGPHWFGPVCVWIILLVATRFTVKGALTIGPISTLICLAFLGYCTYLLFNVSFRDPGICLAKEIPDDVPQEQRRQWRWCDFCSVYQPPDGAHCPDCNVCIGESKLYSLLDG
jgi:hypothetical protein